MEQFLNGAGSKAFDIAVKSGVSYATSFAMKKMTRMIDDQLNKTITTVVTKSINKDNGTKDNEETLLKDLKALRNRIDLKIQLLNSALEEIVLLSKLKGMSGVQIIQKCNLLINPLIKEVENWIEKNQNNIKESMQVLENEIDSVCSYLQLALQTLLSKQNVSYNEVKTEVTKVDISLGNILKAGVLMNQMLETYTCFECSLFELKSFHDDVAIWKEMARRNKVYLESTDETRLISIKQSFDDDMYHEDEDKELTKTIKIDDIEKFFYNKDAASIGLDEIENECIVLKMKGENQWIALSYYERYEDSDTSDEESEDDQTDLNKNSSKSYKNLAILLIIFKLLKIEHWEGVPIVDIENSILEGYFDSEEFEISVKTEQTKSINDVTDKIDTLNID